MQTPAKALVNLHTAQDFAEQLNVYILLSSWASVGWSEPTNIHFLSHDIQRVLYLVLLRDDIILTTSEVVYNGTLCIERMLTQHTFAGSVFPSNITLACLISPDGGKRREDGREGERRRGDAG